MVFSEKKDLSFKGLGVSSQEYTIMDRFSGGMCDEKEIPWKDGVNEIDPGASAKIKNQ